MAWIYDNDAAGWINSDPNATQKFVAGSRDQNPGSVVQKPKPVSDPQNFGAVFGPDGAGAPKPNGAAQGGATNPNTSLPPGSTVVGNQIIGGGGAKKSAYQPQNESVSSRARGLMTENNPLMRQARAQSAQAANRRGLLNSSMATQAGEVAALGVVMPIAGQEAGQAHTTNLQGRDIESQQFMQERGISAQSALQQQQIAAQKEMQAAEIAAQQGMLSQQITAEAELDRMRRQTQLVMQQRDTGAQREFQQTDIRYREGIAALDRAAQERIAQMNLSANERATVGQLVSSLNTSNAAIVSAIMSNPEIPGTARQAYLDWVGSQGNNNINLIEQLYGFQFESGSWGDGGGGGTQVPPPDVGGEYGVDVPQSGVPLYERMRGTPMLNRNTGGVHPYILNAYRRNGYG